MDAKKHVLSDQLSPKGKTFSRLGWCLAASLIVITGFMLNNSFKSPLVGSLLQGSYGVSNATTSLHSSSSSSSSVSNATEELQKPVDNTEKTVAENQEFLVETEGDEVDLEDGVDIDIDGNGTQFENSIEQGSRTANFDVVQGSIQQVAQDANGSVALGSNGEAVGLIVAEEKGMESNKTRNDLGDDPQVLVKEANDSIENCDLFDGRWVKDDHLKPYYRPGSCPYVDKDFNCQHNGRPDKDYIKWKWQPNGCNVPRLNATDFLERLRGKRMVFIGDSLNRNMWESMVCILRRSIKNKKRVYEISGRSDFKKKGFYAFRFEDYNCSVDFVAAPFLVKESSFERENATVETLRLDLMDPATSKYHDADLMVFNTGHWWTHEKTSKGEDYYQEGDHVYPRLKVLSAYQKALATWSRWVDKNVASSRTRVFFRGYSVTHFWGGQWNSGGQCNQETEPISNETYLTKYPSKMRAVEYVIQSTKTPVIYLNISRLTDYRKDGHPSIYRREIKTEEERNAAVRAQDCSHWCLPGVPDTWNELLYASLLKLGKGM